jgi:hypothetical protein
MSPPLFRSKDEWKAALLTLPDNAYFDLMRSVFGNIKTPFNKHHLMEDLVSFLSRRETLEIITAYIDKADQKILTAIAVLGEPAPGDLESFFSGEYSYLDIHAMLLNLEERFIVYRFQEDGIYHLALNPILESVLTPCVTDRSALLPSVPFQPSAVPECPLDDRMIAALFAFVLEEGEIFKAEGGFRKKVIDEGKRIFSSLNIEYLIGGLYTIGLFFFEENQSIPDTRRLMAFRDLSFRERREYLAGGIYSYCQDPETIKLYPHQGRTQNLAQFVHHFICALEENRIYPRTTLKRLMDIIERDHAGNSRWGEVGMIPVTIGAAGIGVLLEAMAAAGLMVPAADSDSWRLVSLPVEGEIPGRASGAAVVIAMDTPFSCILYPEISFADALTLAAFCSVRETGTAIRFEMTRKSVVRGFDLSFDAAAMADHLERLSGKSVDQNLRWTLEDWENRYSGVALYQGTVLVLSEERRYLAQTEPVASLIARTLGPGVYLLSVRGQIRHETDEVIQGLQKAGVDIIARPPFPARDSPDVFGRSTGAESRIRGFSPYPHLKTQPLFAALVSGTGRSEQAADAEVKDAAGYQERFHQALRKKSLPGNEANELAARIDRRLILNESQLDGGAVRGEKMEARNLDYVGKNMVAKQAIALKSPVEILCVTPEGESSRIMGIPGALEKWGSETILVLKTIPEGNEIRLPLGKISLLRRIKQSIFGE